MASTDIEVADLNFDLTEFIGERVSTFAASQNLICLAKSSEKDSIYFIRRDSDSTCQTSVPLQLVSKTSPYILVNAKYIYLIWYDC